jgi:hypothetical protein
LLFLTILAISIFFIDKGTGGITLKKYAILKIKKTIKKLRIILFLFFFKTGKILKIPFMIQKEKNTVTAPLAKKISSPIFFATIGRKKILKAKNDVKKTEI